MKPLQPLSQLNRYSIFGWLVWQLASRLARRRMAQNRGKLAAAGTVGAVLVGVAVSTAVAET